MNTAGVFDAQTWKDAAAAAQAAPLRTLLALLGLMIGVAAVVLVFALGSAARTEMLRSIQALGSNMVMVFPVTDSGGSWIGSEDPRRRRLTLGDARALKAGLPGAQAVAPQLRQQLRVTVPGRSARATVVGVDGGYFDITRPAFVSGGRFDLGVVRTRGVILSSGLAARLFPGRDPMGQGVRIRDADFRVEGIYLDVAASRLGGDDGTALLPLDLMRQRLGGGNRSPDELDTLFVQFDDKVPLADAATQVTELLRSRLHVRTGESAPFTVQTTEEFARSSEGLVNILRVTLGAVASISLVVGGIGIMNIMLVAVAERTREIGIRLAVGATPRHIRVQFLVEAVLICFIGGCLGVAGAVAVSALASWISPWALSVSVPVALGALVFSMAVGVLAGYMPAARASRLAPIEALRYE